MLVPVARREPIRAAIRRELNRPKDDDLYQYPEEYDAAIETAARYYRRLVSQHYPNIFYEEEVIPVPDGGDGSVYPLPQEHFGEIEVWAPPGPPRGSRLLPGLPESRERRFYLQGRDIYLTSKRAYNPGLIIRWVPYEPDEESPVIPAYFDRTIVLRAAYEMARKPGFMGDPNQYRERALMEWRGDPQDPSDSGVLGTISRQAVDQGWETIGEVGSPWWRGLGGH